MIYSSVSWFIKIFKPNKVEYNKNYCTKRKLISAMEVMTII